jgi:hypothetical protein
MSFDWTKLSPETRLSPHFQLKEHLAGFSLSHLNKHKTPIDRVLAVMTVAELARRRFNEMGVMLDKIKNADLAIDVSSGVRTTPKTSFHATTCIADDFKPSGLFAQSGARNYEVFYGCFVWALSQIEESFGLGYYPQTKSGIHVDAAFEFRAKQNKSRNCLAKYGFRGYRWGQNRSLTGNEAMLKKLNTLYSILYSMNNPVVRPWRDWAVELGVNLKLMD